MNALLQNRGAGVCTLHFWREMPVGVKISFAGKEACKAYFDVKITYLF
jgi:hypothetical protein